MPKVKVKQDGKDGKGDGKEAAEGGKLWNSSFKHNYDIFKFEFNTNLRNKKVL